jgi:hypothetical protein
MDNDKKKGDTAREQRLNAALRENLRRRKAQARERAGREQPASSELHSPTPEPTSEPRPDRER